MPWELGWEAEREVVHAGKEVSTPGHELIWCAIHVWNDRFTGQDIDLDILKPTY